MRKKKTAMKTTRDLTFEDLTKTELIALLRECHVTPSQWDLRRIVSRRCLAQYEVAKRMAQEAWEAYRALSAEESRWHACAAAWDRYFSADNKAEALMRKALRMLDEPDEEHEQAR